MRKTIAVVAAAALVLLGTTVAIAATAKQAPEKVKIADCQAKQGPVEMSHKAHVGLTECKHCHHTQADLKAGSDAVVQKCGECHVKPAKDTTPKCADGSMTKNPFHVNCLGCHKDAIKKDAKVKAPTKCGECHKKG